MYLIFPQDFENLIFLLIFSWYKVIFKFCHDSNYIKDFKCDMYIINLNQKPLAAAIPINKNQYLNTKIVVVKSM